MSLLFGQYVRGSAAGARVFEYMNMEPTIPIQGGLQITNNNLRGQVSLNNVTFTYPSRPEQSVLEDFNLEIPGGKICALVGASGGGKSTVASLLERFYDCDNGSLTIDGVDIKTLDLRWLRRNCIGYINQVFFSFFNILFWQKRSLSTRSIITSKVLQIISVMKTETLVFPEKLHFKNSSVWQFNSSFVLKTTEKPVFLFSLLRLFD